jgi:hypothetical protein
VVCFIIATLAGRPKQRPDHDLQDADRDLAHIGAAAWGAGLVVVMTISFLEFFHA